MSVRVWSSVDDRLVEVVVEPSDHLRVEGLPERRARTTVDRVRSAVVTSGLVEEVPACALSLVPALRSGPTCDLDLALALAVLVRAEVVPERLGWVFATGRLGLDGRVFAEGLIEPVGLGDVVRGIRVSGAV